jgi:uncharacterized protein with HEPN domain
MSSREIELFLVDIFIAIDKIERYTHPFDNAQDFLYSEMAWDATIRELEVVGEATNNLLKADFLDQEYRIIVDFRNQISHGYFGVNENIVWDVIQNYLQRFLQELFQIIKAKNIDLKEAIECSKEEYSYNQQVLIFLDNLYEKLYLND